MALSRERRTPVLDASVNGICEMTLETADPRRLAGFYRRALGMRELSREDDRVWLAAGENARLGLWTPGSKEFGDRGGTHVHFALSVAPRTLDDLARRLRAEVGRVEGPVEHDGGDRSLYFRDPEGNVVELWDFFHRSDVAVEGVDALSESAAAPA